jgi:hypothetical protein
MLRKHCIWIGVFSGCSILPAFAQEAPGLGPVSLSSQNEAYFVSWRTKNSSDRGFQLYMPQTATANFGIGNFDFDFGAKSAFVMSSFSSQHFSGDVSTATDTVLQFRASWNVSQVYKPFFTLATSLPTGQAKLSGDQKYAIMDADLV